MDSMTTPEKSVEEIVEELIRNKIIFTANSEQGEAYSEKSVRKALTKILQTERKKREEMVEHAMWNLNAKIEEADFARKVGEKTGNAEAVYEVQDVIRQIKALTQRWCCFLPPRPA